MTDQEAPPPLSPIILGVLGDLKQWSTHFLPKSFLESKMPLTIDNLKTEHRNEVTQFGTKEDSSMEKEQHIGGGGVRDASQAVTEVNEFISWCLSSNQVDAAAVFLRDLQFSAEEDEWAESLQGHTCSFLHQICSAGSVGGAQRGRPDNTLAATGQATGTPPKKSCAGELLKIILPKITSGLIDVNNSDWYNSVSFPLALAAESGAADAVQFLLTHGADVHARDDYQKTALFAARTVEVAELLIAAGADVNGVDASDSLNSEQGGGLFSPLCFTEGAVSLFLIQQGALVDAPSGTVDGVTPLHYTTCLETGKMLLKKGARVDPLWMGATPLRNASQLPISGLQLLLDHGASVTIRDGQGETPLFSDKCATDVEAMKLLVAHGADLRAVNSLGETLLHRASSPEVVTFLLNEAPELAGFVAEDAAEGFFPVHSVSQRGCIRTLEAYLRHPAGRATINKLDGSGEAVLHKAVTSGYDEFVECFLKHGSPDLDPNVHIAEGKKTALHLLVQSLGVHNSFTLSGGKLLIEAGAHVGVLDESGENVLQCYLRTVDSDPTFNKDAAWSNYKEVVALLEGALELELEQQHCYDE